MDSAVAAKRVCLFPLGKVIHDKTWMLMMKSNYVKSKLTHSRLNYAALFDFFEVDRVS